jgi:hypothetical protein
VVESAAERRCFPSTPPLLIVVAVLSSGGLAQESLEFGEGLLAPRGSPRFVDWEGRKAHFIGIRPVHLEWTVVDG